MSHHFDTHSFKLVGERLRQAWHEIETAPLPLRMVQLLEQLKRDEAPSETVHRECYPLSAANTSAKSASGEALTHMTRSDRSLPQASAQA